MKIIRKALAAIRGLFTGFIQRNAGMAKTTAFAAASRPVPMQLVRVGPKIGRNEPCTCGSGSKFKKCHGA
jgi:preprotein translocase subunit SecA